jgi:hypothetical protein
MSISSSCSSSGAVSISAVMGKESKLNFSDCLGGPQKKLLVGRYLPTPVLWDISELAVFFDLLFSLVCQSSLMI